MSFSRSQRNDRRRRVMRETIATDSEYAVEAARAQKRTRRVSLEEASEALTTGYRDPGYSQAVRKTCQQRLVQLIPIRKGALAAVLSVMWVGWGLLLLAHYLFHVRGTETGRSSILFLQLFDLRSPHSIANWMTCQLWTLTAIVSWMIYRIRQHKLDDYRAKYRIWIFLCCVALFSSFDAATSSLFLLGQSIDGWTRREIGYGGWPLVLATYASLIAILGVRLSSELRTVPTAVVFWFGGLLAWAAAALLGTGLLKLQWSPGAIDVMVGACWLGGVLLVFQSAGVFLRHCYIQAQKRFVERAVVAPSGQAMEMPKLPKMPRMPWQRAASSDQDNASGNELDGDETPSTKRSWKFWQRSASTGDDALDEDDTDEKQTDKKQADKASSTPPKTPMRLFGVIPSRTERNEQLIDEPVQEDDGGPVDMGLTKRSGWFGIGGNKSAEPIEPKKMAADSTSAASSKPVAATSPNAPTKTTAAHPSPSVAAEKSPSEPKGSRIKRWLPFGKGTENKEAKPEKSIPAAKEVAEKPKSQRFGWIPFRKGASAETADAKPQSRTNPTNAPAETKPSRATEKKSAATSSANEPKRNIAKQISSKMFGWLDGLKLKPPVDDGAAPIKATSSSASTPSQASPKPIAASQAPLPSTTAKPSSPQNHEDDDDDASYEHRHLSKAERKRLRRQQGNDRNAA